MIIFEELLPIHLKFNCDDDKAAKFFRESPTNKKYGKLKFEGTDIYKTIMSNDD